MMTEGELTGAIVAHAAVACGTTTIDLMAGRPHGAILDARTLAVWLATKLRPDWDQKRIGVSFNMGVYEVVRYQGRAKQKRARDIAWRNRCERVLELIQEEAAGPKLKPAEPPRKKLSDSDPRRWELEPLTERDTDTVNWGGEGFGRAALKKQNAAFAAAMIAAGYRPTMKLEPEPEKVE